MQHVKNMLQAHPASAETDIDAVAACIAAAFACGQACTSCADACLAGENVEKMRYCIRTDLDCADACIATGRILSRQTQPSQELLRAQVEALATACRICGDECEKHAAKHEHCRICGQACRDCEAACNRVLQAIGV